MPHLYLHIKIHDLKITPETQIGYQKRARTTDHMFILKTFIGKYALSVNLTFIHVSSISKKPADSIIHEALLLKLLNIGIRGSFLYSAEENV